ncbi:hypothetical protein [Bradyrhizobium manausense]|uniref:Uncharacterized protein n=1 Tax=Bradyrhizobium manausense TaxID=989370 RepID=A0A0R3E2M3_9BRAD|nr:hypothetical protein [Bradyrhizobium manausense]KRQ14244.1 hypothetical protein AOQ71_13270 [Bradyrhizobium manausense]
MSTDDDIVKADLALDELPRARTETRERALAIVRHLANTTGNNGSRTVSIETAQADAWLSICAVGQSIDKQGQCPDELWEKAIALTRRWRLLLTF